MATEEQIKKATQEKQWGFSELHKIMIDTMSEDNDLTTEEWYERIGAKQEDLETTFKGWTEQEINQYFIYSTRRSTLVSQYALQQELIKFLSTLTALEKINKETNENGK